MLSRTNQIFLRARAVAVNGAWLLLCAWLLVACEPGSAKGKRATHFAEMKTIRGTVFIDPFPVERVLSVKTSSALHSFYAYKVGFENNIEMDKTAREEWERYVNYSMGKDWVMMANQDSLPVVFNQAVVKRSPNITENVLVFEVPTGVSPQQVIYRDGFSHGEDKTFLLKSKTE